MVVTFESVKFETLVLAETQICNSFYSPDRFSIGRLWRMILENHVVAFLPFFK